MGLDSVEFLMAVEETFGVEISDQEAQFIATPAELTRVVLTKIETSTPAECLSQRAFHLLRRTFTQALSIPRSAFRPDTALDTLIQKRDRARIWEELRRKTGAAKWPTLQRPMWVAQILVGFVLAVLVLLPSYLQLQPQSTGLLMSWVVGSVAAIGVAALGWRVSQPLSIQFPRRTVGELAQYIVAYDIELISSNTQWTTERVGLTMRDLLIEHSGITDFTDETPFKKIFG